MWEFVRIQHHFRKHKFLNFQYYLQVFVYEWRINTNIKCSNLKQPTLIIFSFL